MFANYLKTALRSILRERTSFSLNIAGLTLGITSSLVLFLLVKHLSTFDRYHAKADRIYRVVTESDSNNDRSYTAGVPRPLPDAFRQDFPEAEVVTFTSYRAGALIRVPQTGAPAKKFQEEAGVVFAQPSFFAVFDRPMISGDPLTALDDPKEAVISQSLAKKYFGDADALGRIVAYDTVEYTIAGIMADHPENTDFPFTLMLSYATVKPKDESATWRSIWSDEQCYILLHENETPEKIQARMPAFVEKYLGKENFRNQTFTLQPLRELHFDTRYSNYNYRTAPRELLIALAVVAVFLILTGCINFINLSTAEAIKRSKEVGVRKVLGSSRRQLVGQFLGEATLVTSLSMLLSLGATQVALRLINPFLDVSLRLDFTEDGLLWVFVICVTAGVSLLSGLYPSLVISGFRPVLALKNQIRNRSSSGYQLRKGLVVLQFVISQFFIMGTLILLSQMDYFQSRELGFRKDAVVVVPIPEREDPGTGDGASKMRTLRQEINRLAGVEGASLSSTPPSSGSVSTTGFRFQGEGEDQRKDTQIKEVDGYYLDLYDIPLLAGKNLGDHDTARAVIVNEQLLRVAGMQQPEEIIGRELVFYGRTLPVIGVVSDFHTVSLRDPLEPTVLANNLPGYRTLSIRLVGAGAKHTMEQVKNLWESTYPEHIFDYQFLDEQIREFYDGENNMTVVLTVFTFMAIFIGCLGLFGLATFMANQKTKEIGVRKALGASVASIVYLFSLEYVKLIFFGFAIAAPAVWYLMNEWLDTFAYKIAIGPMIFIAGLSLTLVVAMMTVGYKSFRAAAVSPIRSLRYE